MTPSSYRSDKRTPWELFHGRRINAKRELRIGFGDYAQVHGVAMDNSMKERTEGAIALMPTGNLQGSVRFGLLKSGTCVVRDKWDVVPMPSAVIDRLNELAAQQRVQTGLDPVFRRGRNRIRIFEEDVAGPELQIPDDIAPVPELRTPPLEHVPEPSAEDEHDEEADHGGDSADTVQPFRGVSQPEVAEPVVEPPIIPIIAPNDFSEVPATAPAQSRSLRPHRSNALRD